MCVCVHVFVIGDTCCCWKRCGNDEHQVTTYAVGPNLIGLLLSMKIGVAPGAISQTFLDTFLFIYPFYGPVYFCSFCLLQSCFLCHLGSHDFFFWLFTFAYCIWICTEGNMYGGQQKRYIWVSRCHRTRLFLIQCTKFIEIKVQTTKNRLETPDWSTRATPQPLIYHLSQTLLTRAFNLAMKLVNFTGIFCVGSQSPQSNTQHCWLEHSIQLWSW